MSVLNSLQKLRQKAKLKDDLVTILETPAGKRFFEVSLKECHVTRPVFHSDTNKLRECEGRRRFAMSLLTLLGQDDPQQLITKLELETKDV